MKASQWCRRLLVDGGARAVALMLIGWLGIARAEALAGGDGRFLRRQMVWGVVALVAMFAATLPSYRLLARWSYVAFCRVAGAVGGRLSVSADQWAPSVGFVLGPVGLQPSEFAKLAFVLGLARYLMYRSSYRELPGLLAPLTIVMVPLVLVLKEPDLGTAWSSCRCCS